MKMSKKKGITVEIDRHSGLCFGVVNAISQAEEELASGEPLYCLGEIVHNNEEVERLKSKGLITITHSQLEELKGEKVLLRAHGEPPQTYKQAMESGVKLIDASCPVVLKLQSKVREGWKKMQAEGGQIVIFGKKGHAEVVGLVGQTDGNAIVVERINEIDSLDFTRPIELFAQTTISADDYKAISDEIKRRMFTESKEEPINFRVHNSICGQVANRKRELVEFSKKFDVIVFVSGKKSSNGKMLFEVCKFVNPKTYFVSSYAEVDQKWFAGVKSVGVCGATSTPLWLMEQVAERIGS
jgi:4-hydroxy-3-methylbut-2-en-1-yl diphosphate reductase